jgi:hypothetical protein
MNDFLGCEYRSASIALSPLLAVPTRIAWRTTVHPVAGCERQAVDSPGLSGAQHSPSWSARRG